MFTSRDVLADAIEAVGKERILKYIFGVESEEANDFFKEAENYKRLEIWLEELKELREYKRKMKTQFLDDIENPLEPIKLSSALESEIFKYEYRAEHDPQKISPLDYTIIYALKHCLEEQLKEVE